MKNIPITADMSRAVVQELKQSRLFSELKDADLSEISKAAGMVQYAAGETVMLHGEDSDSFIVIVEGEALIKVPHENTGELIEIARIKPFDTVGELGLLLDKPRSATVEAGKELLVLKFDRTFFTTMFEKLPSFALVACKVMASRLDKASRNVISSDSQDNTAPSASPEALKLLPIEFIQRHRVLPLSVEGNMLLLGFTSDPTPQAVSLVKEQLPGMEIRTSIIDPAAFNDVLKTLSGAAIPAASKSQAEPAKPSASASPELDKLLRRMVAERASDLHICSGLQPHWRIDGSISVISDAPVMSADSVMTLMKPIMPQRNAEQFANDNDTDFAHAIPGLARFRVNMFCDNKGPGVVFRQIPDKILTIEQLGLPLTVRQLCDFPKGLILVTGPTGSGKSTTLAAMIDYINKTRDSHIITLEDPIEFVHVTQKCLVNQREVGPHTKSFSRALRAALREDPDIVLVGEMRDLETVQLALEVANTGHLVFGTLHTNTAVSTLARIIDMFPAAQQNQVRAVLADTLKGVVAQTLCKKTGGGRVAALEILVSDSGIANLIRDGKAQMIMSAMQTGKARGNRILNDELLRLVQENAIQSQEALSKAVDKADLLAKLGMPAGPQQ